jgi:mevalonate pyrophosphate decarboxylase
MKIHTEGDVSNSLSTFDVKNKPDDFMLNQDTVNDINITISKLASSFRNQADIDDVYDDKRSIVQKSMYNKLTSFAW